tara:strand:+ start:162 stop:263 length:102 start_codon:yes stop_codon:yes gene_type:complete
VLGRVEAPMVVHTQKAKKDFAEEIGTQDVVENQ